MDNRYINREEALSAFCEFCGVCPKEKRRPCECEDILGNVLEKLPVADAVEVVRCKDCKHYTQKHGNLSWNAKRRYCNRSATVATSPEDYCSFGEKRVE